ncbi:MAG: hypothetical protein DRP70_09930 [Spirochaetes bacterium]|nr:MAG: hypothetical protein DRP60_02430 [Spirochaetota bacterium]RKX86566.1 MAG: hypothetical protein DRP70_09930 [Spirochaetota bacterium]RKX97277.1 MAG: hypothetical protein DRZ90_06810 [Spirochaetota bacterium]
MSTSPKERLVFGEWLIHKDRMDAAVLKSALDIQNAEKSDTLRTSPRMLGQILLDDFQVFRSRVELNNALIEFEKVKQAIEFRKGELNTKDKLSPQVKTRKNPAGEKASLGSAKKAADRSLFGQFLIEKRKINEVILEKALNTQNLEYKETLRRSHRLLGEILMDDFNVFSSRVELNRLLIEFDTFKAQLESQRTDLMFLTRND